MLTKRQNLLETIKGGNPDRYVNQFEPFALQFMTPREVRFPEPDYGGAPRRNWFGVLIQWPKGTPGSFPVHGNQKVIKDITHWKDFVTMPDTNYSEEEWAPWVAEAEKVDRNEQFVTYFAWPGIFESLHYLMGMEDSLVNFYEEPECMHELIDFLTEYELRMADTVCDHIHPDAIYRHDDWGSQLSTFMSKQMFREFLLEPTKKIYDYYRSKGVVLVVHHTDSYCETFVPEMIEAGIDIWQGAMSTNNLPKILQEYGKDITIMGSIDNGKIDRKDWTKEAINAETDRICELCGTKYFIPNTTYGGVGSVYEGVYEAVSNEINVLSKKFFK